MYQTFYELTNFPIDYLCGKSIRRLLSTFAEAVHLYRPLMSPVFSADSRANRNNNNNNNNNGGGGGGGGGCGNGYIGRGGYNV